MFQKPYRSGIFDGLVKDGRLGTCLDASLAASKPYECCRFTPNPTDFNGRCTIRLRTAVSLLWATRAVPRRHNDGLRPAYAVSFSKHERLNPRNHSLCTLGSGTVHPGSESLKPADSHVGCRTISGSACAVPKSHAVYHNISGLMQDVLANTAQC